MPADTPGPLPPNLPDAFERRLKAITAAVAVVGVVLTALTAAAGFYQTARTQAVAAARPYLERKLKWCAEASELAAFLAVHGKDADPSKHARFWQMYWGVMGMVEQGDVEHAMVAFGRGLDEDYKRDLRALSPDNRHGARALEITHACRREMSREWSAKWGLDPNR